MELHQLFGYGLTDAGLKCSSSHPTVTSTPNRSLNSLKFDIGSSRLPFSSQLESETLPPPRDKREQQSSAENLSISSASCNYTLETNSNLVCSKSDFFIDPLSNHVMSGSDLTSLSGSLNSSPWMKFATRELEATFDDVVTSPYISYWKGSIPLVQGQKPNKRSQECYRLWSSQPQASVALRHRQFNENTLLEKWHKAIDESLVRSRLEDEIRHLLIECAKALSENNTDEFDKLVRKAWTAVSICGGRIRRLGACMVEGLVARRISLGTQVSCVLKSNGAIAEACRNDDRIHIIDFRIAQGTQWVTLLQALAARPGGAPHVRITGIDNPVSVYACRGGGLEEVERKLAGISEQFKIPVEFNGLSVFSQDVTRDMLDIRPGEALAVNFPLQLHRTPDESVDVNNPRDGLLRMVKSISPKVITLIEQESNTNTSPFLTRFVETLDYYSAMFESIDMALPRDGNDWINTVRHCLARDIVNIISCEGKERVGRHELFGKWRSRLQMAGFSQYPLSAYVNSVIRSLLRQYSENFTVEDKEGAMLLGWKQRSLISVSAWH
ncbi:chitin-inducible gibberellin-responsive protein 1-like isoform X2 [Syzygium oleosum]|uniref:chitin-inducible gibberellin-responsive protein 1-like isoform X2 n=1 Tax=Syzygium oleosum TaxID=219896 RepID=UPI0024BB88C9|nr:chitin-inducible gibberellin-responsive protein 1-like isoform X2 [Syzygium oleosum]